MMSTDITEMFIKTCVFTLSIVTLSACGDTEKVEHVEEGDILTEEIQEPSTILIKEDTIKIFQEEYLPDEENLSEDEKDEIKKHVLSYMDML
ncbi:hypothetical protein ACFSTA_17395 [Ornithinibacillus salinisoli]|uniref:Uncharacterized protein n=1 Tax=Ornithinibacillus salinisoli TaxID=1848459 RepID=A0ABW4W359_9BACI